MTTRRRLALVVQNFPQLSETFIASKFKGLLERGWDVHIVCTKSPAREWQNFPALDQPRVRKRVHHLWPYAPIWAAVLLLPAAFLRCTLQSPHLTLRYLRLGWRRFGWRTFWQLYQDAELVCLRPGLVHFEFGAPAAKRMYLKELLECKIAVSFRGYDINYVGLEAKDTYQDVWEKADGLHFLGEDLWRRAQRRGCPAGRQHALIPPAIDSDYFAPVGEKETGTSLGTLTKPLRILSVGRLEWKKGYEYALQAVKLLAERGVHCQYRILGGGEYLEALAFARHQLGLEDRVEFLGAQPRGVVKEEMQQANVFLHAAVSEGFCNAVLEAQAMQLPVVCSDADGLAENVAGGTSGYVVPRRDAAALAEKLALLARQPSRGQLMGLAGRDRVLNHFQIHQQLDAFEHFYLSIL